MLHKGLKRKGLCRFLLSVNQKWLHIPRSGITLLPLISELNNTDCLVSSSRKPFLLKSDELGAGKLGKTTGSEHLLNCSSYEGWSMWSNPTDQLL